MYYHEFEELARWMRDDKMPHRVRGDHFWLGGCEQCMSPPKEPPMSAEHEEHPDRMIARDELRDALPPELAPFVDLLPGCDGCDDVAIDTSIVVLLRIVTAMVAPQPERWRQGVVASIGRVLDHELISTGRPQ